MARLVLADDFGFVAEPCVDACSDLPSLPSSPSTVDEALDHVPVPPRSLSELCYPPSPPPSPPGPSSAHGSGSSENSFRETGGLGSGSSSNNAPLDPAESAFSAPPVGRSDSDGVATSTDLRAILFSEFSTDCNGSCNKEWSCLQTAAISRAVELGFIKHDWNGRCSSTAAAFTPAVPITPALLERARVFSETGEDPGRASVTEISSVPSTVRVHSSAGFRANSAREHDDWTPREDSVLCTTEPALVASAAVTAEQVEGSTGSAVRQDYASLRDSLFGKQPPTQYGLGDRVDKLSGCIPTLSIRAPKPVEVSAVGLVVVWQDRVLTVARNGVQRSIFHKALVSRPPTRLVGQGRDYFNTHSELVSLLREHFACYRFCDGADGLVDKAKQGKTASDTWVVASRDATGRFPSNSACAVRVNLTLYRVVLPDDLDWSLPTQLFSLPVHPDFPTQLHLHLPVRQEGKLVLRGCTTDGAPFGVVRKPDETEERPFAVGELGLCTPSQFAWNYQQFGLDRIYRSVAELMPGSPGLPPSAEAVEALAVHDIDSHEAISFACLTAPDGYPPDLSSFVLQWTDQYRASCDLLQCRNSAALEACLLRLSLADMGSYLRVLHSSCRVQIPSSVRPHWIELYCTGSVVSDVANKSKKVESRLAWGPYRLVQVGWLLCLRNNSYSVWALVIAVRHFDSFVSAARWYGQALLPHLDVSEMSDIEIEYYFFEMYRAGKTTSNPWPSLVRWFSSTSSSSCVVCWELVVLPGHQHLSQPLRADSLATVGERSFSAKLTRRILWRFAAHCRHRHGFRHVQRWHRLSFRIIFQARVGFPALNSHSDYRNEESDEESSACYVECAHGFVLAWGLPDEEVSPICHRLRCGRWARKWLQQHQAWVRQHPYGSDTCVVVGYDSTTTYYYPPAEAFKEGAVCYLQSVYRGHLARMGLLSQGLDEILEKIEVADDLTPTELSQVRGMIGTRRSLFRSTLGCARPQGAVDIATRQQESQVLLIQDLDGLATLIASRWRAYRHRSRRARTVTPQELYIHDPFVSSRQITELATFIASRWRVHAARSLLVCLRRKALLLRVLRLMYEKACAAHVAWTVCDNLTIAPLTWFSVRVRIPDASLRGHAVVLFPSRSSFRHPARLLCTTQFVSQTGHVTVMLINETSFPLLVSTAPLTMDYRLFVPSDRLEIASRQVTECNQRYVGSVSLMQRVARGYISRSKFVLLSTHHADWAYCRRVRTANARLICRTLRAYRARLLVSRAICLLQARTRSLLARRWFNNNRSAALSIQRAVRSHITHAFDELAPSVAAAVSSDKDRPVVSPSTILHDSLQSSCWSGAAEPVFSEGGSPGASSSSLQFRFDDGKIRLRVLIPDDVTTPPTPRSVKYLVREHGITDLSLLNVVDYLCSSWASTSQTPLSSELSGLSTLTDNREPGSVTSNVLEDNRVLFNMITQIGDSSTPASSHIRGAGIQDNKKQRLLWFRCCIQSIVEEVPAGAVIAFPWAVGCNRAPAPGQAIAAFLEEFFDEWSQRRRELQTLAEDNPELQIVVVQRSSDVVTAATMRRHLLLEQQTASAKASLADSSPETCRIAHALLDCLHEKALSTIHENVHTSRSSADGEFSLGAAAASVQVAAEEAANDSTLKARQTVERENQAFTDVFHREIRRDLATGDVSLADIVAARGTPAGNYSTIRRKPTVPSDRSIVLTGLSVHTEYNGQRGVTDGVVDDRERIRVYLTSTSGQPLPAPSGLPYIMVKSYNLIDVGPRSSGDKPTMPWL